MKDAGEQVDCMVAAELPSCQTEEDRVALQDFAATIYTGELATLEYLTLSLIPVCYSLAGADTVRVHVPND